MVSLVKLSEVTEDGVKFQSPHDQSEMLLTPEKSMEIQNAIGQTIFLKEQINSYLFLHRFRSRYYDAIR